MSHQTILVVDDEPAITASLSYCLEQEGYRVVVASNGEDAARLVVREVLGGAALGLVLGLLAYAMLKRIDNYQVEILISLALVTAGYVWAEHLHLSPAITTVMAGLLVGNQGRAFAMSDRTRQHLDTFWELIDEILNALLFVILGVAPQVETVVFRVEPDADIRVARSP